MDSTVITNLKTNRIDIDSICSIANDVSNYPVAKLDLRTTRYELVQLPPDAEQLALPKIEIEFEKTAHDQWNEIKMISTIKFSARCRSYEIHFIGIAKAIYVDDVFDFLIQNYLYNYMAGLIGTEDAIQKLKYLPLPDYLPTDKPINDWEHPKVKWHYESSFYDLKVLDSVKRGKSGPRPISKYNVKKVYN